MNFLGQFKKLSYICGRKQKKIRNYDNQRKNTTHCYKGKRTIWNNKHFGEQFLWKGKHSF